jgi:hypothetical protein
MKRIHSESEATPPVDVASMVDRRSAIVDRLEQINGPHVSIGSTTSILKSNVHWDHVMQEMVSENDTLISLKDSSYHC